MHPSKTRPAAVRIDFRRELKEGLLSLDARHLRRRLHVRSASLDFSSNDYLGLARHRAVVSAARRAVASDGAGSGASRLLSGNLRIHEKLERALAAFKKEEAALVFSSGYLANLGAITALAGEGDVVLLDRLNHASLVDAARLSGAKLWVYPHLDLRRLGELLIRASAFKRRLVVTDAYFSMDGHAAPLDRLLSLCEETGSLLMIDEAHSTGVYGRSGRGLTEHFGLCGRIPVVMGTLSKALGSGGGYIAGSRELIDTLVNRAKSFIYTTAPVPAASAAALASLKLTGGGRLKALRDRTGQMRAGLEALGVDLMGSEGPIIPIRIGDSAKTLLVRDALRQAGIETAAIRPPTVPRGTDRIRLSISAAHSARDIEKFLSVFTRAIRR